jgi:hypothetical protein
MRRLRMGELKNTFYINQLQDVQPLFGLIAGWCGRGHCALELALQYGDW